MTQTNPYIPDSEASLRLVRDFPLASLYFNHAGVNHIMPVPFIYRDSEKIFLGHTPRRNIPDGLKEINAIAHFQGPNAYVSARWYTKQYPVPTWNFVEVNIEGKLTVTQELGEIEQILQESADTFDGGARIQNPWRLSELPADYKSKLIGIIVGLKMVPEQINGYMKLDQHQTQEDQEAVIASLRFHGSPNSLLIADLMEKNLRK